MVELTARAERRDGVTLVAATLTNAGPSARRVRVESELDGPVWVPRREGVPAAGYRPAERAVELTVPAGERRAVGFASPAPPVDPPATLAAESAPADAGTAIGDSPAAVVRALGDPTPPADAVPAGDVAPVAGSGRTVGDDRPDPACLDGPGVGDREGGDPPDRGDGRGDGDPDGGTGGDGDAARHDGDGGVEPPTGGTVSDGPGDAGRRRLTRALRLLAVGLRTLADRVGLRDSAPPTLPTGSAGGDHPGASGGDRTDGRAEPPTDRARDESPTDRGRDESPTDRAAGGSPGDGRRGPPDAADGRRRGVSGG